MPDFSLALSLIWFTLRALYSSLSLDLPLLSEISKFVLSSTPFFLRINFSLSFLLI